MMVTADGTVLSNCIIDNNLTSGSNTDDAAPVITNCAIANNRATWGGGIYCAEYSTCRIVNCTVAGNTAATDGAGEYVFCHHSYTSIMNAILHGHVLDAGGNSDIYFICDDGITGSKDNWAKYAK